MKRIAITGASGLLGSEFVKLAGDGSYSVFDRHAIASASADELSREFDRLRPDCVIHCAAHTNVEGAESEPDLDFRLNAALPRALAQCCRATNSLLVHFSSTGCYGNWKNSPYIETDALRPTTTHHRNKAAAEEAVVDSGCDHLIFRLGWLYGGAAGLKKNFVWNRLLEAHRSPDMTSDSVQRGCPTHARDVAQHVLALVDGPERGVFNLVAHGDASRYEYVAEIVHCAGLPCVVRPGPAFVRKAPVSPNEAAVNDRLGSLGLDHMQDWRVSLTAYVAGLTATPDWTRREVASQPYPLTDRP